MKNNNYEEIKVINNDSINKNKLENNIKTILLNNKKCKTILIYMLLTLVNLFLLCFHFVLINKNDIKDKNSDLESRIYNRRPKKISVNSVEFDNFMKEIDRPYLQEINKKRTFEKRLPLTEEIHCKPHFRGVELAAFLSFLTENTIYFETGSGCSSVIAKYYAKKSYAVEGCRDWYEEGVKNGLKENILFRDLKPDNKSWSFPGRKSTLNDWKKYFQAYDPSFNADVILLDGRFKVATAMDIFDKIKDDTIVLIHEYQPRTMYYILENYYQYIYHWGELMAFMKKKDVDKIPLEVQQKYWAEVK
jgi:hypothetical protein